MKKMQEALQGAVSAAGKQQKQRDGLLEQVRSLLQERDPWPMEECPLCQGGGWFLDGRNGRPIRCPLHVTREAVMEEVGLVLEAGYETVEYEVEPWHEIRPASRAQEVAMRALQAVRERGGGMVYLYGPTGVGKSYLVRAFALWCGLDPQVRMGLRTVRYLEGNTLTALLMGAVNRGTLQEDWTRLASAWVLVLDELDKAHLKEFLQGQLFALLNFRYEMALAGRAITVVAANEPPEFFGAYVASRLRDERNFVVPFRGEDLRRKSRKTP